MTVENADGSSGQSRLSLRWTPGLLAAQGDNNGGAAPGRYRLQVTASDGTASASRTIELVVSNSNQAPVLLPLPLQLVRENQTLAFSVKASDADGDATRLALLYDETTPAGVTFDANSGSFEWTPSADAVDNGSADSKAFNLRFSASDGTDTTQRTVQVRVLDANRPPEIASASHALLVGQEFSLPVLRAASLAATSDAAGALRISDPDGASQSERLTVSFSNLPDGARYDAETGRLLWTPGPGQVGDVVVLATVSDGRDSRTESFTLRVVAEASANAPQILINLTPSTPVLPGQTVVATVRGEGFSPIRQLSVQARNRTDGGAWTTVPLDSLGRLRLTPSDPGLLELRVVATDADGFSATRSQTVRVRDPQDTTAPVLDWLGGLRASDAGQPPALITAPTTLRASLKEQQLLGWSLEIAPLSGGAWTTLAERELDGQGLEGALDLASLDPATLPNGAYQLRLRAWDLGGRTAEITSSVLVEASRKSLHQATGTDAVFQLGDHAFALSRNLPTAALGGAELGNWRLPLLDGQLRSDQGGLTSLDTVAPWSEGARVWLEMPESPSQANAPQMSLSFRLETRSESLSGAAGSPLVWRPVFDSSQGWSLEAHDGDASQPVRLQRQGQRLFQQGTGLPWIPQGYTLTAPDGSRYSLDASGKVEALRFSDGQQWLISDAGIVPVGASDPALRVEFVRDSLGRIVRVSGPGVNAAGEQEAGGSSLAYRYDEQGRLVMARSLYGGSTEAALGYHADGRLIQEPIAAYLGTAAQWQGSGAQARNSWRGTLTGSEPLNLSFVVRGSEIASTVKTPGASGAVLLAVETSGASAQLSAVGATVLGSALQGGRSVTLLRTSEAGLKLLSLRGSGEVELRVSVAGDLDRDGDVDGADSDAWEAAAKAGNTLVDLDGDGNTNSSDRQLLYANYGWQANQGPVPVAQPEGPALKTHTDLSARRSLDTLAVDVEGDALFWRVLSASHGQARLGDDGHTLLFSPEAGYSGQAQILVQADDGYAASAPIELSVQVSGAKLLAIHLQPLPSLRPGQSAVVRALGDFEDVAQVDLGASGDYLHLETRDLSPLGYLGSNAIRVDDSQDRVRAETAGAGLIVASRTDAAGRTISATAALNVGGGAEEDAPFVDAPDVDVYPDTLSLAPGGTRQLKVWRADPYSGEPVAIHTAQRIEWEAQPETSETFTDPETGETFTWVVPATPQLTSGTRYFSSNESVATISGDGLITAHGSGVATISVVHLSTNVDPDGSLQQQTIGQTLITLKVQLPQVTDNDPATPAPDRVSIAAAAGGIVATSTGETLLIGPGALAGDASVGIQRLAVDDIEAITGLVAPAAGLLLPVAAFRLDLGDEATNEPVQLRIPVQGDVAGAQPGEEVLFFRKGQVLQPDGQWHDTWWLVDNGVIEADGSGKLVARTASPPYEGMKRSGDYMISRRAPGMMDTIALMNIDAASWTSFGYWHMSIGGGLSGLSVESNVLGILASQATSILTGGYRFGVPTFAEIELPKSESNSTVRIDTRSVLPSTPSPFGNVSLPNISNAVVNNNGQIVFTVPAAAPNPNAPARATAGQLVVRAVLGNGSYRDVLTLPGSTTGEIVVAAPDDLAIGSVGWQLVRLIPTDTVGGDGELIRGEPLEFPGNQVWLDAIPGMAAILTRTGLTIVRQEKDPATVPLLELVKGPGQGQSDFGSYLTGYKGQPVAFSPDLSRIYVGGNGVIYVFDTLRLKRIGNILIPGGSNISSLSKAGNLLIIGGGVYGGGGQPLLAMNIDPGSPDYHRVISIQGTGIESTQFGVSDISIGPDGKTMVVSVPRQNPSFQITKPVSTGDVLIFNLDSLNRSTGQINAPIRAAVPADGLSGKAPQIITATSDPDRYLVANINDYGRGLSTLVIRRDEDGKPTSAAMNAIRMFQPGDKLLLDRLDVQRAQSAVLITGPDGIEYAVVADDNYNFLDPYWNAMFEAPTFVQTSPLGPPAAVGGAASAKKVNVGGKLGVVKDPFGINGTPEYLGATVPLDGYGIVNLALSIDGKSLVGQLYGGYGTIDQFTQNPHLSQVWDVEALIAAAVAQPASDRLSKPIILPTNARQEIPTNGTAPAGTDFNMPPVKVNASGRMGDVIGIDLKELAARRLLRDENQLDSSLFETPLADLPNAARQAIEARMQQLNNFEIDQNSFRDLTASRGYALQLVTKQGDQGVTVPLSRRSANSSIRDNIIDADFSDSGILFLVPTLDDGDLTSLRAGGTVRDKIGQVSFSFKDSSNTPNKSRTGLADVVARDFAPKPSLFFGDRPLSNPGYSKFLLKGSVGSGQANDTLDVYRVEQRLKYLGIPVISSNVINSTNDFIVDGQFKDQEKAALKFFEKITRYTSAVAAGQGTVQGVTVEVQYRASVTDKKDVAELQEVVGSTRIVGETPTNLTSGTLHNAINAAKNTAITQAKANALQAAGFNSATDHNGMDGLIESNTSSGEGKVTLDWLNAYNAPHWLDYGAALNPGNNQQAPGNLASGWINNVQAGASTMGSSWVYDLMQAAQANARAQRRNTQLLFNGSGPLGVQLNLGINTAYVSRPNQDRVNSKDYVLGLAPITPPAGINDDNAYRNSQWNYLNAQVLASRLRNPNSANTSNDLSNTSGINQQDQALLDFLTVYAATQGSGENSANNGFWNSLTITNGDASTIRRGLFGDGTPAGGLINASNVLLGGTGQAAGAAMTANSLGSLLNISEAVASRWVMPLQKAMAEFNINTPQRIAAFLAQIVVEANSRGGGLEGKENDLRENVNYPNSRGNQPQNDRTTAQKLRATFPQAFASLAAAETFVMNNLPAFVAQYDASNRLISSPRGFNLQEKQALLNYVYATPQSQLGNGNVSSGDGWRFRGHGIKQLTGRYNTQRFADYVDRFPLPGQPTGAQIMANPDLLASNFDLAARSAAWFWGTNNALMPYQVALPHYPSAGSMNGVADEITWNNPLQASERAIFDRITRGINPGMNGADARWQAFAIGANNIVQRFYAQGGNSFEAMTELLRRVGFKTSNAASYEQQFGIFLQSRSALPIGGEAQLLAAAFPLNEGSSTLASSAYGSDNLVDLAYSSQISVLPKAEIAFALLSGGTVAIANALLNGSSNATPTITLDQDAAGYGWFLDPTPHDNEEFLPTADTNVWQAKEDSDAAGRMDLLSVLLHEYAHALGLGHSEDPRDFMAANLLPGQRRLPSAAQLEWMANRVAELQGAPATTIDAEATTTWVDEAIAPENWPPEWNLQAEEPSAALSTADEEAGGWLELFHYLGVVNPTLINPDFGLDGTDNWIAEGDLQAGSNAITLKESTDAPTHLAQIFQINSGDRQLRFTVANLSLSSNSAAPNDAFEVALLNADTTLPALGADGTVPLPDADALLNIQPSGAPSLASALRWSTNSDGSTTYSLDLPESLDGTAVLLSFDLIGFGAADSQVTLRDISLGSSLVPTPSLTLANDTGFSSSDRLTADGLISVYGLVSGATWQFSTDGGSSWSAAQMAATSNSFVLPSGSYGLGQVQVRQFLGGSSSDAFTSFEALTVDTTQPCGALNRPAGSPVIPVRSLTPNGTYESGAVISLQLEFSEAVLVDTSAGTPTLQLETGSVDRLATYSGGSGSTTLTFTYTVQPGDSSLDLDQLSSNALQLQGATIQDAAGNNAVLALAAPGEPGSLGANNDLVIGGNRAPTDLRLSRAITSLPENTDTSRALALADLSISDDGLGTNILSLVGDDADVFELVGNSLYLKAGTVLNYEGERDRYDVRVQVADPSVAGSTPISRDFSLLITNVNEAPTAVELSSLSFDENIPMHSLIATLAAMDPDQPKTPQSFTYSLLPNVADNLIFYIADNRLQITGGIDYADYERQSSFELRLQVSDQGGLSFQRSVTLLVNDLPDTPTYSVSQSATSILEGQSVNFSLATTNLPARTPIYWSLSGAGVTYSDFSDGMLRGSGVLGADGRFALSRTAVTDPVADPGERFSLSFFADAALTQPLATAMSVLIEEPRVGEPSDKADVIIGTDSGEFVTGVPLDSSLHGRGFIDYLTGRGGQDVFVLGRAGQRYYDSDGSAGMAIIRDFTVGQDTIQLQGVANQYSLSSGRFNAVQGTFISVAGSGDRIGFVEGIRTTDATSLNLGNPNHFLFA
jgi:YD repeat-containing protein